MRKGTRKGKVLRKRKQWGQWRREGEDEEGRGRSSPTRRGSQFAHSAEERMTRRNPRARTKARRMTAGWYKGRRIVSTGRGIDGASFAMSC